MRVVRVAARVRRLCGVCAARVWRVSAVRMCLWAPQATSRCNSSRVIVAGARVSALLLVVQVLVRVSDSVFCVCVCAALRAEAQGVSEWRGDVVLLVTGFE